MSLFLNKIKNFFKTDIRNKLKKLNLYPSYISTDGINYIYSKIIFIVIIFSKFFKIYKYYNNKFFENRKKTKNHTHNFLISLPRSGSIATRNMLRSYFELYYKIGNGIPKYDSVNNKWIFSSLTNVMSDDMYNSIEFGTENLKEYNEFYISDEELDKRKIIFSRYPLNIPDLFNFNKINYVIIIREPFDQITSYCANRYFNNTYDKKILKLAFKNYIKFTNFWIKKIEEDLSNKKNFLIIKYDDIVNLPHICLEKILRFYNYSIDKDMIQKAAAIHTKENTMKNLIDIKIRKIRFSDEARKKQIKDSISEDLKNIDLKNLLKKNYKKLVNF